MVRLTSGHPPSHPARPRRAVTRRLRHRGRHRSIAGEVRDPSRQRTQRVPIAIAIHLRALSQ
jgi:hypothetical protein